MPFFVAARPLMFADLPLGIYTRAKRPSGGLTLPGFGAAASTPRNLASPYVLVVRIIASLANGVQMREAPGR